MGPDTQAMTALQGVMQRSVARAREAPRPPTASELSTLEGNVDRLWDLLRAHAQAHHEAGQTNRLTADALAQDRAELHQQLEQNATAVIQSSKDAAEEYRRRLDRAIEPADAPSQERLANARSDAKLALDGVPPDQLFTAAYDLATDGDPAVRHLLLFTPWVTYYARNRDATGLEERWEHAKRQLMAELLTEGGMSAYQSLDAAEDLMEVPARMRNALTWYVKDLPRAARKDVA